MKKIGITCAFCLKEQRLDKDKEIFIKSDISGQYICQACILLFQGINRLDITVQ